MGSVGCSQKWCSPNVYSVYSVCVKCVILCNTVLKKVVTAQLQLLLKILHCTAHKDSPLLKVTLILSTVGSKAPGLHWTKLQSAHIPMYIANCTLYTTRYSSSTANKSAWHQICSPCPCIIFHIAHCTLHIVHCTLHIVQITLYKVYNIKYAFMQKCTSLDSTQFYLFHISQSEGNWLRIWKGFK